LIHLTNITTTKKVHY